VSVHYNACIALVFINTDTHLSTQADPPPNETEIKLNSSINQSMSKEQIDKLQKESIVVD